MLHFKMKNNGEKSIKNSTSCELGRSLDGVMWVPTLSSSLSSQLPIMQHMAPAGRGTGGSVMAKQDISTCTPRQTLRGSQTSRTQSRLHGPALSPLTDF